MHIVDDLTEAAKVVERGKENAVREAFSKFKVDVLEAGMFVLWIEEMLVLFWNKKRRKTVFILPHKVQNVA